MYVPDIRWGFVMNKQKLRILIGENIRSERVARNISIDELAEMLELTSGFVGLIERGQRGTTPCTLLKIADIFSLPIDKFFYKKEDIGLYVAEEPDSERRAKRKKISSLTAGLSSDELEFVIQMIKNVRNMHQPQDGLEREQ